MTADWGVLNRYYLCSCFILVCVMLTNPGASVDNEGSKKRALSWPPVGVPRCHDVRKDLLTMVAHFDTPGPPFA